MGTEGTQTFPRAALGGMGMPLRASGLQQPRGRGRAQMDVWVVPAAAPMVVSPAPDPCLGGRRPDDVWPNAARWVITCLSDGTPGQIKARERVHPAHPRRTCFSDCD